MIEVNTKPKAGLNVSKVAISLNSAAEFSMQFSVVGWGKFTDAEGNEVQEVIHRVEDSDGSSERYVEFIELVSMITDDLEQYAIEHMN